MEDPIKISFPKIKPIYWKALMLGTMAGLGFALCIDLNSQEAIGTLLLSNAVTLGFSGMIVFMEIN